MNYRWTVCALSNNMCVFVLLLLRFYTFHRCLMYLRCDAIRFKVNRATSNNKCIHLILIIFLFIAFFLQYSVIWSHDACADDMPLHSATANKESAHKQSENKEELLLEWSECFRREKKKWLLNWLRWAFCVKWNVVLCHCQLTVVFFFF